MEPNYSIDLEAKRCVYKEPGRTYVILPDYGHIYKGLPCIITVIGDKVLYNDKQGHEYTFTMETVRIEKNRGIGDSNYLPLIYLTVGAIFQNLTEPINYVWQPSDPDLMISAEELKGMA